MSGACIVGGKQCRTALRQIRTRYFKHLLGVDPVSRWLRLCATARWFATGTLSIFITFPGHDNSLNVSSVEDSCGSTNVIFEYRRVEVWVLAVVDNSGTVRVAPAAS